MQRMFRFAYGLVLALSLAATLDAADIDGEVRVGRYATFAVNARVQLLSSRFVVDERIVGTDGRFKFRNINPGAYVIAVHLDGYLDEEVQVGIERRSPREFVPVTLQPVAPPAEGRGATVSVADFQIPKEARREYDEGLKSRKRGDCAKAISHLRTAVMLYEPYADALEVLGDCLRQTGKFEEAESAFAKAIQHGQTIFPYVNLAELYSDRKRFAEAETVLQQATARYPAEGDLHLSLALVYFAQGRLDAAEKEGIQAHVKLHRNSDVHLLLSKVYLRLKRYPELARELETYLVENPKSPMAEQVRRTLADLKKQ